MFQNSRTRSTASTAAPSAGLPPNWSLHFSETRQKHYLFNCVTNERRWQDIGCATVPQFQGRGGTMQRRQALLAKFTAPYLKREHEEAKRALAQRSAEIARLKQELCATRAAAEAEKTRHTLAEARLNGALEDALAGAQAHAAAQQLAVPQRSAAKSEGGAKAAVGEESAVPFAPPPGSTVYAIREMLDRRSRDGGLEYLVSWQGYAASENSWQPEENLAGAMRRDFDARFEAKRKKRKAELVRKREHEAAVARWMAPVSTMATAAAGTSAGATTAAAAAPTSTASPLAAVQWLDPSTFQVPTVEDEPSLEAPPSKRQRMDGNSDSDSDSGTCGCGAASSSSSSSSSSKVMTAAAAPVSPTATSTATRKRR